MGIVFVIFKNVNVLFKCHAEQLFSVHGNQNVGISTNFGPCVAIQNVYHAQMNKTAINQAAQGT